MDSDINAFINLLNTHSENHRQIPLNIPRSNANLRTNTNNNNNTNSNNNNTNLNNNNTNLNNNNNTNSNNNNTVTLQQSHIIAYLHVIEQWGSTFQSYAELLTSNNSQNIDMARSLNRLECTFARILNILEQLMNVNTLPTTPVNPLFPPTSTSNLPRNSNPSTTASDTPSTNSRSSEIPINTPIPPINTNTNTNTNETTHNIESTLRTIYIPLANTQESNTILNNLSNYLQHMTNLQEDDIEVPRLLLLGSEEYNQLIENDYYENLTDNIYTECPIRQEQFEPESEISRIRTCKHVFFKDELDRWLQINNTCPTCRLAINTNTNTNNLNNTTTTNY
ncbi:hypothetical protein N8459_02500 [Nitrosopumilus sp.]|nr:hypothetical protein [Nitrosopumilus sp.]